MLKLYSIPSTVRHIHALFQLIITTILNVFTDEEIDSKKLNISPSSTQLVGGEGWNLNTDMPAFKALLFTKLSYSVDNPLFL